MATDKGRSASVYRLMLILLLTGVESQSQAPPNTGLYFTLNGTVYLPGDTILITNIGSDNFNDKSGPGSSLVCVTTNVNIHCCNSASNPNGGAIGREWFLPDGTRILNTRDTDFYRTRYNQTVRLNRRNNAMSPIGVFTCEVPNMSNKVNHIATITIAVTTEEPSTSPPQTTVATTIPPLTVMIVSSGGTLTCEASGGVSIAYTYMWLRNGSVVSGQTSSTYSFSPLLAVHSGRYSCRVSDGSMTVASEVTIERTATQLYFTWRGNRYEPSDSILIIDIGVEMLVQEILLCVSLLRSTLSAVLMKEV